jgi:hypothetical protein
MSEPKLDRRLFEALASHRQTEAADIDFLLAGLGVDATDDQRDFAESFRKQIFSVGVNIGWEAKA